MFLMVLNFVACVDFARRPYLASATVSYPTFFHPFGMAGSRTLRDRNQTVGGCP